MRWPRHEPTPSLPTREDGTWLLGARLNIANGASGSSISDSISVADIWLSLYNASDWSSLTKAQKQWVNALASTFDDYNNGELGPGHCP